MKANRVTEHPAPGAPGTANRRTGHRPDRTIVNPIFKDTATFLKRSDETGGRYCECEVTLLPGGKNVPHLHKKYSETFRALEGNLGVKAGGKTIILRPGETFTVPIGVVHCFFNPGPDTIRFNLVLSPGFEGFEYMLRILYGLARDGQTDKKGLPKRLALTALVAEIGDTSLPGVFVLLAPLLRFLAARARKRGEEQRLMNTYCNF
ncbi:MAG TPA: cupin domain-containing protein [Cytophagales bacterium]|jgi:mannose-6-phosphate isomerase-like protein (cupin superfamily)